MQEVATAIDGLSTGIDGITVEDDGTSEGTDITTLDFGDNLAVAVTGSEATITAPDAGVTVEDSGTQEGTEITTLNFDDNLNVTVTGSEATIAGVDTNTGIDGITVEDGGVSEGTEITTLDFGDNLAVAVTGSEATITAPDAGVTVEDGGTEEGTGITTINFDANLAVAVTGSEATITGAAGGIDGITVEDGGTQEGTDITTLNFGDNLDVTVVGSEATVAGAAAGTGGGVTVEDSGTSEGTGITTLNFDDNLDVTVVGTEATITGAAAGSGGSTVAVDVEDLLDERVADGADVSIGTVGTALSASVQVLSLAADATQTLSMGDLLRIDDEVVLVTAVSNQSTFTVSREAWGTDDTSHTVGTTVSLLQPGAGRVINDLTFLQDDDTNDNVFDLGRPLVDDDDDRDLHLELSWISTGVRVFDAFNVRVGQLRRLASHPLTGSSLHETLGHVVTRSNQDDLSGGTFMEIVYAHRRLTATDEALGHGTADDDAIVVALKSGANTPPLTHVQAYIYLSPTGGGISGVTIEDGGTEEGTDITTLNFGDNLDVTVVGTEATVTGSAGGTGGGVTIEDGGTEEGTSITTLNFAANLSVAVTGTEATITAPNARGVTVEDGGTQEGTSITTLDFGDNLSVAVSGTEAVVTGIDAGSSYKGDYAAADAYSEGDTITNVDHFWRAPQDISAGEGAPTLQDPGDWFLVGFKGGYLGRLTTSNSYTLRAGHWYRVLNRVFLVTADQTAAVTGTGLTSGSYLIELTASTETTNRVFAAPEVFFNASISFGAIDTYLQVGTATLDDDAEWLLFNPGRQVASQAKSAETYWIKVTDLVFATPPSSGDSVTSSNGAAVRVYAGGGTAGGTAFADYTFALDSNRSLLMSVRQVTDSALNSLMQWTRSIDVGSGSQGRAASTVPTSTTRSMLRPQRMTVTST